MVQMCQITKNLMQRVTELVLQQTTTPRYFNLFLQIKGKMISQGKLATVAQILSSSLILPALQTHHRTAPRLSRQLLKQPTKRL